MRSGGSASLSVARRAGRTGRPSVPHPVMTPATAGVAVEATPPVAAATAAEDRTHPAAIAAAVEAVTPLVAVGAEVTPTAHARCTRRCVQSVGGRRKSPSSRARTSRCIAASASSCAVRQRRRGATTTSTRANASELKWAALGAAHASFRLDGSQVPSPMFQALHRCALRNSALARH